ncbi:MAG TPA: Gfo/Idh/MocA family oxidoreductase [Gemmataceae bacterium]|jgi:predicted dehydrogenase
MAKTIKVGVITNAEGAHLDAYLPALAHTEEAEAVVLADPSGRIVAQARKALGAKLKADYKDAAEMLKKEQPRMVLVSLEAKLAPPAIDAALEAGCHVFCEKPACVRAEDFAPLVHKAQQKHCHLMLALANRIHAPVREARRIVRDGLLGKIYGAEIHLVADQTRLKREAYRKEWYCIKARSGGGNLIWLGIHWLDLALFITGLKVKQTAGFAGVVGGQPLDIEDSAAVALRFDNGVFGTMTAGYYLDKGYQSHLQIWGEHGWLRLAGFEEQPLEWYSNKDEKEAKVRRFEYAKGQRGYTPFVRAAVRASAGLEEPPITGEEGLHVLRTIFAFYQAAQMGRTQSVQ